MLSVPYMLAGHKELELPTAAKAISTITTKLTDSFNLKVLVSKLEFAGLSFRKPKTFMPTLKCFQRSVITDRTELTVVLH